MGNIRKLKADYKQCTYNLIANEILLIKMQDDTRVSLAAKGLFWQLMNLPDEWELNETGLSTITGESTYKIKNLLKELKDWGYISSKMEQNEKGIFTKQVFIIREVTQSPVEENPVGGKSSDWETKSVDIQSVENHSGGFYGQYNNIINNNIISNNDLKNNDLNNYENFSKEKYFEENSLQQSNNKSKDCSHVSHTSTTSSLKLPNVSKQDVALDNNQDTIKNVMAVTDPVNQPKQKKQRKKETKNTVQQMEEEKGDSIRTLDTQLAHKLSDMTAEDNENSNLLKTLKELKEMELAINKTNISKRKNIHQLQGYIDSKGLDIEVADKLKDFIDVKVMKSGPMNKISLDYFLEDLYTKSNKDKNLMITMLREASKLGWADLYVTDKMEQQAAQFNTVQKTEENNTEEINDDDFAVVDLFDENGNKIKF